MSAQISTICGLYLLPVLFLGSDLSCQPCEGAMLLLPTNNGKVKGQNVVFLLFPVVPSS